MKYSAGAQWESTLKTMLSEDCLVLGLCQSLKSEMSPITRSDSANRRVGAIFDLTTGGRLAFSLNIFPSAV